ADLNYTLRDSNMDIYALPRAGFAGSYYEQAFPVPSTLDREAVLLAFGAAPPCPQAEQIKIWTPYAGAYRGKTLALFRVPPACLGSAGSGG
ncbi:MAG: hypothetical protein ACC631_03000, partial [Halocynthiibacter sp.]